MHVDDNIAMLKMGIEKGETLPKAVLKGYESYLTPHIVDTIENSYFYEPFTRIPESIAADKKADFIKRGKAAIEKSIVQGYQTFHDFIVEEYRPNAADAIGISAQPGGENFYQQQVEFYATLPMTADDIFEKGK
ncbi:MAG: hypothetical protein ACI9XO_000596 [Paraglaciecola sp.]|jgi:uncharacterized protein (DUF885 family)